jgi:cobalamin biosynthesis protein CobT
MPGSEDEAAALLDTYLASQLGDADAAARSADEMLTGAPTGAPLAHDGEKPHENAG